MLIETPYYISNLQHLLTSRFLKSKVSASVHNQAIREVEQLQSFLQKKNKHIFGFFVTLKRSHLDTRKVFPMIEDTQHACVQGCMGHWNNDFKKYLDNQMIVSKIIDLVKTIQNSDSRYRHFVRLPLKNDLDAHISITFMIAPIYLIDIQSGYLKKGSMIKKFNNRDYGIISELNGHRATYLPHVFPDKNFHEIKTSLLQKAGISLVGRTSNVNFYAYDCCIYDCKLNKYPQSLPKSLKKYSKETILEIKNSHTIEKKRSVNSELFPSVFYNFINFMNRYYRNLVPYLVFSNQKIIRNVEQDVRNLASIYDILQVDSLIQKLKVNVKSQIEDNLLFYINKYQQQGHNMRQSSSFLILSLNILNPTKYKRIINAISRTLLSQLDEMERDFELGECLIALSKVHPSSKLKEYQQEMEKEEKIKSSLDTNDIFRLNWDSKFLFSLWEENIKTSKMLQSHALLLYQQVRKKLRFILDTNMETNYWAVTFECLCSLLPILNEQEDTIINTLKELTILLNTRKNEHSLYKFKNEDARIDITGHVLNGFLCLVKNKKLGTVLSSHNNNKYT